MKHTVTTAIVLSRTNYGEADRIITLLTPGGKIRALAKGVRKIKSKLAGGVELFSVSEVTVLQGKGELQTLISGRLQQNFANIIKDLQRTNVAYEILKTVGKITEDRAEAGYFELTKHALEGLNNEALSLDAMYVWFMLHLVELEGKGINLVSDDQGKKLIRVDSYSFSIENMCFKPGAGGFTINHIKFLRLAIALHSPTKMIKIKNSKLLAMQLVPLARQIAKAANG